MQQPQTFKHDLTVEEIHRIAVEELDAFQRSPHAVELRLRINLGRENARLIVRAMIDMAPPLFDDAA